MAAQLSSEDSSNDELLSSAPPRRRNLFNEAVNMVGNGGLGRPAYNRYTSAPRPSISDINQALDIYSAQFLPSHPRALSGIAIRAFLLGSAFTTSAILSTALLYSNNKLWRAPVFVSSLSLFHFLEFYITAIANTPDASVSSFLLSSNGPAYTLAHTVAFTECLLSHTFYPSLILPPSFHYTLLSLGFCFVVIGQIIRTLAMYTAGTNFSHLVAHQKRAQHQLITSGVYRYLRHPSYFGFFWWGIGTQLVCGNSLSLVGFSLVLWYFFWKRIKGEEESLIRFFGKEYEDYRKRTFVGIPFI